MVQHQPIEVSRLSKVADEFRARLKAAKRRIAPESFDWYPYDSLSALPTLNKLFSAGGRSFLELADNEPILDIGCGDGDVSFFFESLGYKVHALDYSPSNFNGMRGIRALKTALNSSVAIHEVDLDSNLILPHQQYGLAWCTGLLYHLQNPYKFLQATARQVKFCILSTRIFKFLPNSETDLSMAPVAYLLDDGELNSDNTNYWIFSEAGLKRLLARTGWSILDYGVTSGKKSGSDPLHVDQRAYCFLRSRIADPDWRIQLLDGWHHMEQASWRWTEPRFTAILPKPSGNYSNSLKLQFYLPEEYLAMLGPITLKVTVDGQQLRPRTYNTPGMNLYAEEVPSGAAAGKAATIEVEADRFAPPTGSDERQRAILIPFFLPGVALRDSLPPLRLEPTI